MESQSTQPRTPVPDQDKVRRRTLVALATGSLLEWYDFAVYASLASILGGVFFSSQDPVVALLATFSVFAVGYFARPLGAIYFGRMADRKGRKFTLIVVITLMGVGTVLMGVIPTYSSAGVLAPILLVLGRVAQGLSVGGEFGSATAYLVELAPTGRRGVYGSVIYLTAGLGFALGLGLVYLLNVLLGESAMGSWGWRIPFLLSLPLLLIGAYLRSRATESPAFAELVKANRVADSPLKSTARDEWRPMGRLLGIIVVFTISSYTVLAFALSYLLVIQEEATSVAYPSVLVATTAGALSIPFFGALSDRVGRRPVLVAGCVALIFLAIPGYLLMESGGFVAVTLGQLLIWVPNAAFSGACPAAFCELFPTQLRSTSVGVPVALATAIFSGTTPAVLTFLVQSTGNPIAPAYYLVLGAIVSIGFMWTMRETAHAELVNA
jgi:MFS transporter, MHS family, proline/betaine transporter